MKQIWNHIYLKKSHSGFPLCSPLFTSALWREAPPLPKWWCLSICCGGGWDTYSFCFMIPADLCFFQLPQSTHKCIYTSVHRHTCTFPNCLFWVNTSISFANSLTLCPFWKRNFPIWKERLGENLTSIGLSQTGRHSSELKYWGWRTFYFFLSLDFWALAPYHGASHGQILLLFSPPSHNWVNLPFPVSSLMIWRANLIRAQVGSYKQFSNSVLPVIK